MATLVEPKGSRCPRCQGAKRHRSKSGKTMVRCRMCKGNGLLFPQPFRRRTWWAPLLFWTLFLVAGFLAIEVGAPSWAP